VIDPVFGILTMVITSLSPQQTLVHDPSGPQHKTDSDRSVVSWIILGSLFKHSTNICTLPTIWNLPGIKGFPKYCAQWSTTIIRGRCILRKAEF